MRRNVLPAGGGRTVRLVVGSVAAVGGVIAIPVATFGLESFAGLYCATAATIAGGALIGIGALGMFLLAAGAVGGFCSFISLLWLSWADDTIPWHLRAFGWVILVCLVAGTALVVVSVRRSTRERGWPWPH